MAESDRFCVVSLIFPAFTQFVGKDKCNEVQLILNTDL